MEYNSYSIDKTLASEFVNSFKLCCYIKKCVESSIKEFELF